MNSITIRRENTPVYAIGYRTPFAFASQPAIFCIKVTTNIFETVIPFNSRISSIRMTNYHIGGDLRIYINDVLCINVNCLSLLNECNLLADLHLTKGSRIKIVFTPIGDGRFVDLGPDFEMFGVQTDLNSSLLETNYIKDDEEEWERVYGED